MDITLDKKGNTEASIRILLKEEDYQPQIEEKVKEYRKRANLKGFRPGKVPAGLIKKMYGKAIKVEEINELLAEKLPKYIRDNNLKLVGEPLPDPKSIENIDWANQSELEFSYDVGYVSDFTYDLSDQVKVTKYVIPVTEEKIDETIENLKKRFGKTEDVEGASERNDQLTGVLSQVKSPADSAQEDQPKDQPSEIKEVNEAEEDVAALSHYAATIDISDLGDEQAGAFIGAQTGDEIFFDIREVFPEDQEIANLLDREEAEVRDVQGEFSFRVETILRQQPAEMNQEFYDSIFGKDTVADEAAFREKVREAIQDNYQQESELLLMYDIRNYFVEHTEMEVPRDFLRRWLLATDASLTEEQLDKEFENYIKEIKWSFLSSKIAEDREIKIDYKEVKQKARETVFAQFGMTSTNLMNDSRFDPIVDNYLQAENGSNYMRTFNQTRTEKILDEIRKAITIEEKEVTTEEFNEQFKNR